MEKKIFEKIKANDIITIFGHVQPDGDCYGSQIGLKDAILATFPNKKVYVLGSGLPKFFKRISPMDEIDDGTIKNSLAIVLDVANKERVEDQRFLTAKDIIKVDHHIYVHTYGSVELIDNYAIATAQIIARIIERNEMKLTHIGAEALMLGIITDSGRFQYGATNAETFHYAEMLMNKGASLHGIYDILYQMDLNDIRFKGYVLSHFVTDDKVCYYQISKEIIKELNVDADYAASFVNLIADIEGYPIWCSFAEYEDGKIRVELRSKKIDYNVQEVAKKYGGGGHIQAAGCRVNSFEETDKIIADLVLLAKGEF